MCAIGQCKGVWVAVHGTSRLILAVGGRGSDGKRRAHAEAKKRQKIYGPPGRIPNYGKDVRCRPMLKSGPAASRIRRKLSCLRRGGTNSSCRLDAAANPATWIYAVLFADGQGTRVEAKNMKEAAALGRHVYRRAMRRKRSSPVVDVRRLKRA